MVFSAIEGPGIVSLVSSIRNESKLRLIVEVSSPRAFFMPAEIYGRFLALAQHKKGLRTSQQIR